jgi:hypothetical protein
VEERIVPFHCEGFGSEGLDKNGMTFNANTGAVGNRSVFMGAFIDAFHKLTFGFSFQRLAAGLSPIVVGEWSISGPRMQTVL